MCSRRLMRGFLQDLERHAASHAAEHRGVRPPGRDGAVQGRRRLPAAAGGGGRVQRRGEPAAADGLTLHDAGVRPRAVHAQPRHAVLPDGDRGLRAAGDGRPGWAAGPGDAAAGELDRGQGRAGSLPPRHREPAARPAVPDGGAARSRRLPQLDGLARLPHAVRRALGADLPGRHLPAEPAAGLDRADGRGTAVPADAGE